MTGMRQVFTMVLLVAASISLPLRAEGLHEKLTFLEPLLGRPWQGELTLPDGKLIDRWFQNITGSWQPGHVIEFVRGRCSQRRIATHLRTPDQPSSSRRALPNNRLQLTARRAAVDACVLCNKTRKENV